MSMNTLKQIEAAVESLPSEEKEELLRFLGDRLRAQRARAPGLPRLAQSKRGFPISKGHDPFTSADVVRIELETELYR